MNNEKRIGNKIRIHFLLFILFLSVQIYAQQNSRKEIKIPDILGFKTLKCDFHIHTVFSDGDVWPDVRVEEAWKEGLDAIAITDHIDYLPDRKDMVKDFNRSFEIANKLSDHYDIIVIKGAEITKKMPPGHFNMLFIQDANSIDTTDYITALKTAKNQGAFIQWNHPFWKNPNFPVKNSKTVWYPQHQELFDKGLLNGIEIANDKEYYPVTFKWCIEEDLTILGNSDIHSPTGYNYDFTKNEHRPITLVFAEKRNSEAIKEALFAHRTAVYFNNMLLGKEKLLKEIFNKSVELSQYKFEQKKGKSIFVQLTNNSDIPYSLISSGKDEDFNFSQKLYLPSQRTVILQIDPIEEDFTGERNLILSYRVKNLLTAPDDILEIEFKIGITVK